MLAGAMSPVIRKHQSLQQLFSACLKSSSTSEILLSNYLVTEYLQRARNKEKSNWVCPRLGENIETMR